MEQPILDYCAESQSVRFRACFLTLSAPQKRKGLFETIKGARRFTVRGTAVACRALKPRPNKQRRPTPSNVSDDPRPADAQAQPQ